jgi:hypothetical protein
VKPNRGAPGIDGVSCEDFPAWSRVHWQALRQQIESGRYQPQPVRRVEIPKPGGGTRLRGIPTVMDRVIQQAIAQVLTPLFDPGLSTSSFGCRPGCNAHQAIKQVQEPLLAFKHRVKAITGRSWGVSLDHRLKKLAQYLQGWFGYFGICQYYRPIPELDEWTRQRVRMCYWTQWRWARTKIRHMFSQGVALKAAIQHGVSSLS